MPRRVFIKTQSRSSKDPGRLPGFLAAPGEARCASTDEGRHLQALDPPGLRLQTNLLSVREYTGTKGRLVGCFPSPQPLKQLRSLQKGYKLVFKYFFRLVIYSK